MLDFDAWAASIKTSLVAGLNNAAEEVERAAKQKAPVRRIFRGDRRQIRFKSAAEVQSERVLLMRLGIAPQFAAPPGLTRPRIHGSFGRVYVGGSSDINRVYPGQRAAKVSKVTFNPLLPGRLQSSQAMGMLSARGRYEVRSMRAFFRISPTGGTVGGRLRGEIYTSPAAPGQPTARVISPTPYAKYQEFGTRRHPAQPFLRPALAESQGLISTRMREALSEGVKTPLVSSGQIVLTVKV